MTFLSKLRAVAQITIFAFWTVMMIFVLIIAQFLSKKKKDKVLKNWHRGVCRIFNIKVITQGDISTDDKTIYVANHASYIDIPILGSVLEGQFVAKSDVAQWPIFGALANLQNTIYVERRASQAKKQNTVLADALHNKNNLIIFPEGTNTLGDEVKRFKSSLFGDAVMAQEPIIQPVAIVYHLPDGTSIPPKLRSIYGWPIADGFGTHFWQFIQHRGMRATVYFHPTMICSADTNRKDILNKAHQAVEQTVLQKIQ